MRCHIAKAEANLGSPFFLSHCWHSTAAGLIGVGPFNYSRHDDAMFVKVVGGIEITV
jgi:hypothetical protein